jgi:hypothetical protein
MTMAKPLSPKNRAAILAEIEASRADPKAKTPHLHRLVRRVMREVGLPPMDVIDRTD